MRNPLDPTQQIAREPKTFPVLVATIFGKNYPVDEDDVQDVTVVLIEQEPGIVTAHIGFPLYVEPSDIITDVYTAMEGWGITEKLLNVETR